MTNESSAPPAVVIKTVDNGPYQVKGPIRLVDHDNNVYDLEGRRTHLLCRCGKSATKPFCDGTHKREGFEAAERTPPPSEA
jgi:CDGSH iron-sulfur domain-containing protein 3